MRPGIRVDEGYQPAFIANTYTTTEYGLFQCALFAGLKELSQVNISKPVFLRLLQRMEP